MVKRDKLGRFTKECIGKENNFYGKRHKKETKIEHGKVMKEKWKNSEFKEKIIKARKGQHSSPKTEFKLGHIPKNSIKKGQHLSLKTEFKKGQEPYNKNKKNLLLKKRNLENWKNPTYRNKMLSDEMLKRRLQGLLRRPTSYEQKICDLCLKYSLPFIYSGDGRFLINFKNPDFVNEKDKILIEVFYSWFKIRDYGSIENYKEFCRKKYKGWKVIFIDEIDLSYENWEEVCLNKIRKI